MHFLTAARETCRLIVICLFPESANGIVLRKRADDAYPHYQTYYNVVTEKKIPPQPHDPEFTESPLETVRLFFPDVYFPAAPFLLFRMKRRGFSVCRVTVQNGGLLLTATR
ncbi:MAG: hypothetical protein EG828_06070 [Deltaproteobacteria bacterium]|nr:hypothetical protein [Deltaproteobacteria bacterium]